MYLQAKCNDASGSCVQLTIGLNPASLPQFSLKQGEPTQNAALNYPANPCSTRKRDSLPAFRKDK